MKLSGPYNHLRLYKHIRRYQTLDAKGIEATDDENEIIKDKQERRKKNDRRKKMARVPKNRRQVKDRRHSRRNTRTSFRSNNSQTTGSNINTQA